MKIINNTCLIFIFIALNSFSLLGEISSVPDSLQIVTTDTLQLKEVIVEQKKGAKISGGLSGKIKLHAENLSSLPSLLGNTDLLKILEFTPGIQTAGDANSNLYVRGGDPGQNMLLYEGTVLYTPGHAMNFFPLFNADHISTLELEKSGVNAEYGGFLSSLINVKSGNNLPNKNSVKGSIGLLSSQLTLEGRINQKWGIYLSGRKTYIDWILNPLLKSTDKSRKKKNKEASDLSYDFFDANVTVIGNLTETNKLIINFFGGNDNLDISDREIMLDGYLKWHNYAASIQLLTNITTDVQMEHSVALSNYQNKLKTYQADMYIQLLSKVKDFSYKNKLSYRLFGYVFESGIQYTVHDVLPQNSSVYNGSMSYETQSAGKSLAQDLSLFTQAKIRSGAKWILEPGIRYTSYFSKLKKDNRYKNFQSLDWRLSGRYQLTESKFLRGAFSYNTQYMNKLTPSGVGLPTDFWVTANADIRPQKGTEMSIGYYQLLDNDAYEVSSDIYARKTKDVTEFDQNFIENENIPFSDKIYYGKARAYGWELMIKKNTGKLTGWISYALGKAERKFDDINDGKYFSAQFDRTHELSVIATYSFNDKWNTVLSYKYATGSRYTVPSSWYFINNMPVKEYGEYNGAKMPDYNRTDIGVNYFFSHKSSFNFSVYNVFAINNPIYIFMTINQKPISNKLQVEIKKKRLMSILPSVSWRYKF